MNAAALALAEAVLRLGFKAWEAHQAANAAEVAGLSDAALVSYINGISIGDADSLIAEGAAAAGDA